MYKIYWLNKYNQDSHCLYKWGKHVNVGKTSIGITQDQFWEMNAHSDYDCKQSQKSRSNEKPIENQ